MIKTSKYLPVLTILFLGVTNLSAQQQGFGSVSGIIIEKPSNNPLEFANVIIKGKTDSTLISGTVTGKKGEFVFDKLPYGEYKVVYSYRFR